jgi:uncharacterized protein YjbJ (UPF0337 family)
MAALTTASGPLICVDLLLIAQRNQAAHSYEHLRSRARVLCGLAYIHCSRDGLQRTRPFLVEKERQLKHPSTTGVPIMNKDQVKGIAKDIAGKIQEGAGKLVGSNEQQDKGLEKQIEGKAGKTFGDAKEMVKEAIDKL